MPERYTLRFLSPLLAISAGSCVVLSLNEILAEWVAMFWIISSILAFTAFYRGKNEFFSYNFRLITVLLLVSLAIAAHWTLGWQFVLAKALVLMMGIKLMELRSQRDAFQFCGLGVLGLGVASLIRVDLGLGILIFLFFFLGLVLILWQHILDRTGRFSGVRAPGWIFPLKLVFFAFILSILTIITGLLIFFIFPRNINPMLNLGAGLEIHRTGFSPEMSPGSVREIVVSNRVAFRAQIDVPVDPSRLYWRGTVLWETDGTAWKPGTPHDFQPRPATISGDGTGAVNQSITLSPGKTEYLFGLFFPEQVLNVSPVFYSRDRSIKMDGPVDTAIRYQVISRQSDRTGLTAREFRAGLDVPKGLDQRVVELAREFDLEGHDPREAADRIMFYFSTQGFRYSLTSPPGFDQGQTLEEFLLESRTGYCELYAAATTILLRLNNIPARVVVGFWGGQFNPVGGYWIVRDSMAHAWVEAWFEDRGWVLLDPTRFAGTGILDEALQVVPGQETDTLSPGQVVTPAMRVVDWLRWQWTNVIIDLTLARQVRVWRSFRSGIQDAWSGASAPEMSFSGNWVDKNKYPLAAVVLLLAAGCLGVLKLSRRAGTGTDHEEKLRKKAWKRLARKTPGRHDLERPGNENQVWSWWEENHPAKTQELKKLYYAQRYGPKPDLDRDRKLKNKLTTG